MRIFTGCVILEGLENPTPVQGWRPIAQRVLEKPQDPDATLWHVNWYRLDEESLRSRLAGLAQATLPHWYAHFWEGDDLSVILAGKYFWVKVSDPTTWRDFIAYGDTVGIERKWTESIPTELPAWVQEALEA